jgi:hypothetical protein
MLDSYWKVAMGRREVSRYREDGSYGRQAQAILENHQKKTNGLKIGTNS